MPAASIRPRSLISFKTLSLALFKCVLLLSGYALVIENQPSSPAFSKDPKIAQAANAKAVSEGRLQYKTFLKKIHEPSYAKSIECETSNYDTRPLQLETNESSSSIKFKGDPTYKLVVFPVRLDGSSRFEEIVKSSHIPTLWVFWGEERCSLFPEEIHRCVIQLL